MTNNTIGTFFEKAEGRTYELNEGNISVDTGYSTINGAKQKFFKFQYPIGAENFLQFDLVFLRIAVLNSITIFISLYDSMP